MIPLFRNCITAISDLPLLWTKIGFVGAHSIKSLVRRFEKSLRFEIEHVRETFPAAKNSLTGRSNPRRLAIYSARIP